MAIEGSIEPNDGSPANPNAAPATTDPSAPTDANARWRSEIARSRQLRRKLVADWSINVDYRRGKQFDTDSDEDRIAITTDWSATKAKTAMLFSQVPEVRLTPKNKAYAGGVPVFAKKVNEALLKARVGVALDEVLPDCINAAGIGAAMVSYEARMQSAQIPAVPAEVAAKLHAAGQEIPMRTVQRAASTRVNIARISPGDLLAPVSFTGSDFDDAPWVGRSGRLPWAEAKSALRLADTDKDNVAGADDRSYLDQLTKSDDRERFRGSDIVSFEEIFYWRYRYHPEEMSYEAIQRIVFVHGKDEPVIDEPWNGQRPSRDGKTMLGSCRMPIRVLTLTYVTDEAIPPSDSAMGRPQVDEMIRSRSQMIKQRENSLPIRWFDTNRVGLGVQNSLMRGTYQGMIPMNGRGDNAIGEVARANYPSEDFEFNRIAKADLQEVWAMGPEQMSAAGGPASRSATESNIRQQNYQTRVGYERARVARFFVSIAEVVAGLIALYGVFTPEEAQALGSWDRASLSNYYVYDIRADSTVLLDAQQRIDRLMSFLNMTVKSGYIDPEPIIREIADLSGLNPDEVVHKPSGEQPKPMNISFRASGVADLLNPLVVALMVKAGQAPSPQDLEAAKQILLATTAATQQPPPPPLGDPNAAPVPGGPPAPGGAPGAPPVVSDAMPTYNTLSRVEKRADEAAAPSGT